MASGWVEEFLFKSVPDFKFGWFMTVMELAMFASFGIIERTIKGEMPFSHDSPLSGHLVVAGAMTASRGLTNMSLQYLNYPTQVIFKSLKLITVMAGSWLRGKRYTLSDYLQACALVASALCFSLGDIEESPDGSSLGIIIVTVSLFADSLHNNAQAHVLNKTSSIEVMVYSNGFSALSALLVCIGIGELGPALQFCALYPITYALCVCRALVLYLGVSCFLAMTKEFDVVKATEVTTVRKILTILLSFVLFPKPFTAKYLYGILCFGGSLALNVRQGRQRKRTTTEQ